MNEKALLHVVRMRVYNVSMSRTMSYGLKHHSVSDKKSEENVPSQTIDLKLNCAKFFL